MSSPHRSNASETSTELSWFDDRGVTHYTGDAFSSAAAGGDPGQIALPMRTILRQFGEAFDHHVGPILNPLQCATGVLAAAPDELEARRLLPQLRDLQHQFTQLADRIAEQQAYVLIFGPLKSGKSTFMNAICAAYVSEVTALPAYPCMVNVVHAAASEFIVTRYDGSTEHFADRDALHRAVEAAHRDLTDAMRRHEAEGIAFDPATHMPGAIRRIELRLPTGDLAQSGAVLVDTPGLYSRMKFGYDRMTRDFRNAAACAIFIVKTDNLFLEQVFEEFQELLELFSRIFLVVNVDSSKRDLAPDGTLRPSLEHEDPQRIIRAFEDLAMTAPLKAAAEEGRLSIYPVDLLQAASRRIRASDLEASSDEPAPPRDAEFDRLMADLADYLNSNEYLKAFLNDSLRRSQSLLGELAQAVADPSVDQLERHLEQVQRQARVLEQQRQAIDRLSALDWPEQLESLSTTVRSIIHERALQWRQTARHAMTGAIEGWFEQDDSLQALDEQLQRGHLAGVRQRFIDLFQEQVRTVLGDLPDTLELPDQVRSDLKSAGVDLAALARRATEGMDPSDALGLPQRVLDVGAIAVRRRFWDWLLLRSPSRVRQATLGPDARPDRPIPAPVKARRLGHAARAVLNAQAHDRLEQLIRQAGTDFVRHIVDQFIVALGESIASMLEKERVAVTQQLHQRHRQIEQTQKVADGLSDLGQAAIAIAGSVQALQQRFGLGEAEADNAEDAEAALSVGEVPETAADAAENVDAADADGNGDEQGNDAGDGQAPLRRPDSPVDIQATTKQQDNGWD